MLRKLVLDIKTRNPMIQDDAKQGNKLRFGKRGYRCKRAKSLIQASISR